MSKRIGRRSSMVALRSSSSKSKFVVPKIHTATPSDATFDNFSNNSKILQITSATTPSGGAKPSSKFPKIRRRASAPDLRNNIRRLSLSPLASPEVRRRQREQLSKVVEIIFRQYTDILTSAWLHWQRYLKLLHIFELRKDAVRIASRESKVGKRSQPNIEKLIEWLKMINLGPTFRHLIKDTEGMETFANFVEYRKCKKNEILYWQTSSPERIYLPISELGTIDTFYKVNRDAAYKNYVKHRNKTYDEIESEALSKIEKFKDRQKFLKIGLKKSK